VKSLFAGIVLLATLINTAAADEYSFAIRNHNPFLNIFGLPPFQGAALVSDGEIDYGVFLDMASHGESNLSPDETIVIDGESYIGAMSWRYGVSPRLEVGFDLPVVSHTGGSFDHAIENWHDIIGASNSKRSGPRDQLRLFYNGPQTEPYELVSPDYGLGDIQLTAAIPLIRNPEPDDRAISLRAALKLPTGDSETLLGSGATDLSIGLYVSDLATIASQDFGLSGFAGALLLGDGDVLPEIQKRSVGYGGFATTWHATERFNITAQIYYQSAYFDSDLYEIGESSLQVVLGGAYRFKASRYSLSFAIVEETRADAVTDFAVHLALRAHARRN